MSLNPICALFFLLELLSQQPPGEAGLPSSTVPNDVDSGSVAGMGAMSAGFQEGLGHFWKEDAWLTGPLISSTAEVWFCHFLHPIPQKKKLLDFFWTAPYFREWFTFGQFTQSYRLEVCHKLHFLPRWVYCDLGLFFQEHKCSSVWFLSGNWQYDLHSQREECNRIRKRTGEVFHGTHARNIQG